MESLANFNNQFGQWLSGYVRVCPICYGKTDSTRFLCLTCERFAKLRQYKQWARVQDGTPILSLYRWTEREHEFFRLFAASLKGGGPQPIFEPFAAELLTLRAELRKPIEKTIGRPWLIVPAPGGGHGHRDHAEELAWNIAKLSRATYLPCLKRVGQGAQKTKSLAQRWSAQRLGLRGTAKLSADSLYIFVDDIVTTGSTAAYAYKCLGKPPHFEIWTLFNRPRLRGLK